jgi:HAD superfamily hydrolase (TIGR01509 family)
VHHLRGVLLDIDGTLIDSNRAHALAWQEALREVAGLDVPIENILPLIGMGGDKLLPTITGIEQDSEVGQKIAEGRRQRFQERHLPYLQVWPGMHELLERMRNESLRLAVATSASKDDLAALLDKLEIRPLLETCADSDDAEESKPDPDILCAALRKLALPASEVLMLGDTPYDIEAARAANIRTVALRCGGWGDRELRDAIAIYDDPADLLEHYEISPFHEGEIGERDYRDVVLARMPPVTAYPEF